MICPACGYKNEDEEEHRCGRCGRRFDGPVPGPRSGAIHPPLPPLGGGNRAAGPASALAPDWKNDVSARLEQFQQKRARQQGLFDQTAEEGGGEEVPRPDLKRKVIPFDDIAAHRIEPLIVELPEKKPAGRRGELRAAHAGEARPTPSRREEPATVAGERIAAAETFPQEPFRREILCPNPVAPLALRSLAGVLDLAVCTVAVGVFLGSFHLLGGALHFGQRPGAMFGLAAASLFAFYFFLYIAYASETPGLQWMGLCVLDYEGYPPRPGQRLVRALGALLSAAALGAGYLWALADEEGLTWHDRMSKTFITRDSKAPRVIVRGG